jgi:hypothetical protein
VLGSQNSKLKAIAFYVSSRKAFVAQGKISPEAVEAIEFAALNYRGTEPQRIHREGKGPQKWVGTLRAVPTHHMIFAV